MDRKLLSEALFNQINEECPEFLNSYFVLFQFYDHLTKHFTKKVWKDGRIVLTPKNSQKIDEG